MNDKLPLEQLGRYKLVRVLGKGAMGVVYEGLDPRLNRQVAVKTILKSQLVDEDTAADYSARFVREAQAVARLSHPNIVTVFDFGEENEIAYIVMEFIRGRELKDYFDKNEFFSMDEAVRMMCELLDALDYAHKLGIIHRDIKPANLMLDASGRVKLTDFGVARLTDAGHDRTMAGTMVGTPSYMSPEQIKGEAVGPRSDLFAAGVILYQFLTRQKPFTGQGQWSIQKKILEEDPLPPSSFKAVAVPAAFDRIVKRALAKEPEDRYPSAGAFAADLKHALERARVPDDDATRVGPVPGARKGGGETPDWAQSTVQFDSTVAEKRAPAPAAAPASVDEAAKRLAEAPRPAAPAPAAPAPPPPLPPKPAAAPPRVEEPPAEAPRSKMPLIAGGVGALVLVGAVAGWMLTRGGPPAAEPQPPAAAVKPATPEPPAPVAKIEPSPGKAPAEDEQARLRRLDEERRLQEDARRRDEAARQADEAERRKAEDAAKAKAPADDAKARAQEDAKRKADEAARRKADDAAQKKAQDEAQRKAAEEARVKTEQEAKLKAEQEAKLKSEQDAKAKVEQDAKAKADQDAKAKAEQEARRKADEEAKKKAAEDEVKRKAAEAEAARKARTPADLIAEASQLERDGKFAQAVRLYKDAAGKGSGPAAKKLGEIYGRGAGDVGRDYAESVKWYSVARERGESVPTPR